MWVWPVGRGVRVRVGRVRVGRVGVRVGVRVRLMLKVQVKGAHDNGNRPVAWL